MAIRSFRDRVTRAIFAGQRPKGFPADVARVAQRKLALIDAAVTLEVLRLPPGNRFASVSAGLLWEQKMLRSSTTIENEMDALEIVETLPPVHPGEVLREEFIVPLGLTAGRVAKACAIARSRIERIVAEEIGISGDTALRLGQVLGTGPELWMNLQSRYEIETAKAAIGATLADLQQLNPAA